MKDNERKNKSSKIISIVSICICLIGIVISAINLRYTFVNDYDSGGAITIFLCMISVFCANLTIFFASSRKYKNSAK